MLLAASQMLQAIIVAAVSMECDLIIGMLPSTGTAGQQDNRSLVSELVQTEGPVATGHAD